VVSIERNADGFTVHDGVEGAAKGNVGANPSRGKRDVNAAMHHERRHIQKPHPLDFPVLPGDLDANRARWRIERERCAIAAGDNDSALEPNRGSGDDPVAAHEAEFVAVHEQHARVRAR
jgi:hypothetical protein